MFYLLVKIKMSVVAPKFESNEVSTKTIICTSNLKWDIDLLFEYLPIVDYERVIKKRGRKKKTEVPIKNIFLECGSIINLQLKGKHRGCLLKPKKKNSEKYFRNSITIVVMLENGKIINVKLSNNGKFQITGCKLDKHFLQSVEYIYKNAKKIEYLTNETVMELKTVDQNPKFVFNIVMKNVDFKIGFPIQREKLNTFFHDNTEFVSFFDSCIVTGVILKLKSTTPRDEYLDCLEILPDDSVQIYKVKFEQFLEYHEEKEIKKEMKKEKHHTFLCFQSGSCIYSSCASSMPEIYDKFMKLVHDNRDLIEDKIVKS